MIEPLPTVRLTRYLRPLREGGSMPAIVEASDDGMYVTKFHGAGQGPRALVAEVVCGLLGQALGLPVPHLVRMEMDEGIARLEGHDDVRDLLNRSIGLNLGVDYLPGCISYDPAVRTSMEPRLASAITWFDAVTGNVDRTARNTNMLWWHGRVWLIDHGAALVFQHDWESALTREVAGFPLVRTHVLLPLAAEMERVHHELAQRITRSLLDDILAQVPAEWLALESPFPDVTAHRKAYVDMLLRRVRAADSLAAEVADARARV